MKLNICSVENINNYLSGIELDYIINCAAYTDVKMLKLKEKKSLLMLTHLE